MNKSKVEYLKRYEKKTVKRQRSSKRSNVSIVDDDIDFKSTNITENEHDNDDEDPLVAEVRDESIIKWQPLDVVSQQDINEIHAHNWGIDLSPPRRDVQKSSNPHGSERKSRKESSNDLSPPRIARSISNIESPKEAKASKAGRRQHIIKKDVSYLPKKILSPSKRLHNDCLSDIVIKDDQEVDEEVMKNDDAGRKIEDEKFMKWGKGVAQSKSAIEKVQDEEYEMSKPLARYADDEDLEKMLKERQREGDPMLLFSKRMGKGLPSKKKKGEKRLYRGDSAPNRFGILPGYRWDGVNRSNGYEKAWLSQSSNNIALAEESYKWSVEDM